MIEAWGSFLSVFCTILVLAGTLLFYDSFLVRRLTGRRYRTGVFCLLALALLLIFYTHGRVWLQFPLELILDLGASFVLYQASWDYLFFVIVIFNGICTSSSYWQDQLFMALSGLSYEEFVWNIPLYSLRMVSGAALMLLFGLLAKRFHRPQPPNSRPLVWVLVMALFPTLTLAVRLAATYAAAAQWVWQVCLLILNLVDLAALFLLDYMEQSAREREQLIAAGERARVQDENIQALSQAYSTQRKMTHDFRAHLDALADLLAQGRAEEAKAYLHQLRTQQTGRVLLVNTHHAAVDAVLNQKGYQGRRMEIDMRFRVSDLSPLHIPAVNITIVLGNLLDNAIEACAGFAPQERWVETQLIYQRGTVPPVLQITVANPSRPVEIVDGRIATSKKDPLLHGFGLQNVRDILARYGEEPQITYQDGRFVFQCEWPDQP